LTSGGEKTGRKRAGFFEASPADPRLLAFIGAMRCFYQQEKLFVGDADHAAEVKFGLCMELEEW